tara:strand:- start:10 stop:168 length:159 start_codon:yes stop_codon:yes gene_type:complete
VEDGHQLLNQVQQVVLVVVVMGLIVDLHRLRQHQEQFIPVVVAAVEPVLQQI